METSELKQFAAVILPHAAADGEFVTSVPGLTLYRSSVCTVSNAVVYVPSLCVVIQGAKEVVVGGEAYRYDPAQSLLVSVDLPATTQIVEASPRKPCLAMRIEINAADVGELLADGSVTSPGSPKRGIGVTQVEPHLLEAIARLVSLLNTPKDIPALAPLTLREITYRVLTGPQGARLRQIAAPGAPAQRIAQAIGWLKEHFAETAKVESLAQRVGLGSSTFHMHFKAVTGLSPLQYQKQLRLQEARRQMLSDGLDAAEVAFRVGYESASQFGREYRRLFGAPPRQDVASLAAAGEATVQPKP